MAWVPQLPDEIHAHFCKIYYLFINLVNDIGNSSIFDIAPIASVSNSSIDLNINHSLFVHFSFNLE